MKVDSAALRAAAEQAGAAARDARGSGEAYRYELDGGTLVVWTTGTARVHGKGTGKEILAGLAADHALSELPMELDRSAPWVGVDESGKGDYFGPLVSAAVEIDPSDLLVDLRVADSKKLSDARVARLAPLIRGRVRYTITPLPPPTYNVRYAEFRAEGQSLNDLLAWLHARSIEDLLAAGANPAYAIVDQFADRRFVEGRLLAATRERKLRVIQFPRAEADVAVAAASILARDEFVRRLARSSEEIGLVLPKGGGSDDVLAAARAIVARGGEEALASVAKLHFVTTGRVLGRPSG